MTDRLAGAMSGFVAHRPTVVGERVREAVSPQEVEVRTVIHAHVPYRSRVLYNHRPWWLRNPLTQAHLELDIYYPTLKLAVEYNGWQHRRVGPGVTIDMVRAQQARDDVKARILESRGIRLIIVTYSLLRDRQSLIALVTGNERSDEWMPNPITTAPKSLKVDYDQIHRRSTYKVM